MSGARVHVKPQVGSSGHLNHHLNRPRSPSCLSGWFYKSDYSGSTPEPGGHNVYYALRPVIVAAMLLGLMPLTNTTSCQLDRLQFRWLSPQALFSLVLVSCLVFTSWTTALYYAMTPATEWTIEAVAVRPRETVFYVSATVFLLMSIHTAQKLPGLLVEWDRAAERLKKYIRPTSDCALHVRPSSVLLLTGFFMASAVTEHVLHDVNVVDHSCSNTTFLECYYKRGNEYFMHSFPYSLPLSVAVIVLNKFATLSWNFQDLLIALLGRALWANFRVLCGHLEQQHQRAKSTEEWRVLREDHIALCDVVKRIDDVISPTVMLSYAVNIYFLCIQIFYSIRPSNRSLIETIYFCSSFYHLFVRLCVVSFSSASFYDQALGPLYYLQRCPASSYCEEVARFISHLSTSSAYFTGYKFFPVNRSFFLAIVSVVLTYELILLNVK